MTTISIDQNKTQIFDAISSGSGDKLIHALRCTMNALVGFAAWKDEHIALARLVEEVVADIGKEYKRGHLPYLLEAQKLTAELRSHPFMIPAQF